jgi:protein ImuB
MRDARAFLKLITLDLDMHPPGAPVIGLSIAMEPVNPRVVQHGLFVPLAPEPQKLELTLARIQKLVGEGKAGAAELPDTYRPGAFVMHRFAPPPADARPKTRNSTAQRLAVRIFRPALAARVYAPAGRPARVEARGIRGTVVASAGPWRTSGAWWREDAWARDEWDVALSDGALYRVYRDYMQSKWFVEGVYD